MNSKWIDLTILTNTNKYLLRLLLCNTCLTINFCILFFLANIPGLYYIVQQYDMLYFPKHPRKWPGFRDRTWSDPCADWCSGTDELEPIVWRCAVLQAVEYPTHHIVLSTYFTSDTPKNVLAWRCWITEGNNGFKNLFYVYEACWTVSTAISINRLCIETVVNTTQ